MFSSNFLRSVEASLLQTFRCCLKSSLPAVGQLQRLNEICLPCGDGSKGSRRIFSFDSTIQYLEAVLMSQNRDGIPIETGCPRLQV
nr:unnamed protein product [Spirometra erinaceieuropaei]